MRDKLTEFERDLLFFVLGLLVGLLAHFAISLASARDLGQWSQSDPEISEWFRNLVQPDNAPISCCGEADAYWCDGLKVEGEKVSCEITDEREDAPLRRHHVPVGTWIEIPPRKIKYGPDDPQRSERNKNPTGHAVVFLSSGNAVFCYVASGGV